MATVCVVFWHIIMNDLNLNETEEEYAQKKRKLMDDLLNTFLVGKKNALIFA